MDSKLVVEQMSGRWQIKHPGLRPLAAQAAALVRRFDAVRFTWIPRERNTRADALANAAMDGRPRRQATCRAASGRRQPAAPRPTAPRGSLGAAVDRRRHPADPGPARRDRADRAAALLGPRRRAAVRARAGPGRGRRPRGWPRWPRTSRPWSARRCRGVARPPRRSPPRSAACRCRVEPDLIECDFGEWEGLTFAEVRERWPAELDALARLDRGRAARRRVVRRRSADAGPRARGGGCRGVPAGRRSWWSRHVSPIKLILRDALAAGDAFLHRLFLDPAGISMVDYWPDGGVAVRTSTTPPTSPGSTEPPHPVVGESTPSTPAVRRSRPAVRRSSLRRVQVTAASQSRSLRPSPCRSTTRRRCVRWPHPNRRRRPRRRPGRRTTAPGTGCSRPDRACRC